MIIHNLVFFLFVCMVFLLFLKLTIVNPAEVANLKFTVELFSNKYTF